MQPAARSSGVRFRASSLVVLMWLAATLASPSAFADAPLARPRAVAARDHLDQGNRFYNVGSFADAVVEYKAGALIEPAPVFDYNLGQANRQLGNYRDALWHYDRFLHKAAPTGALRDAVLAFMAQMRAQLDKAQDVPLTKPGETPSPSPTASATEAPGARARLAENAKPTNTMTNGRDWVGWGLAGSGLVALGVSAALLYRGIQLNDRGDSEREMRARQELYNQASNRTLAGAITGVAGAALLAAGVIELAVGRDAPRAASSMQISIHGHGMFVAGRF